jgi:hypothetical protein
MINLRAAQRTPNESGVAAHENSDPDVDITMSAGTARFGWRRFSSRRTRVAGETSGRL